MDSIDKAIAERAEQNTDLWDELRLGKFTASTIHKLIGKDADKFTDGAMTYIMEKVAETITGEANEINTFAMTWGHTYEPHARDAFKLATGFELEQMGFVQYTDDSGGSPDDKVPSKNAVVDYKCPANSVNHFEHLLIDSVDYFKKYFKSYYWQLQANMLFTGCERAYFVSYDYRANEYKLFVFEMEKDEADQELLKKVIQSATEKKHEILNKLKSKIN